jgi:magnesium-protoporphyrin IX monomethyl ester (oxidative) cyclase
MHENKILFLKARTGLDDPSPPLSFGYLGGIAKEKGFRVLVENLNAQYNNFSNEDIVELIKKETPDIVGIHIFTNASRDSYKLLKIIKPRCKMIIAGGPHATAFPEEILEKGVDVAFVGEADVSFGKFLDAILLKKSLKGVKGIVYKEKGKIVKTKPADQITNLDQLPPQDKTVHRKSDYAKIKDEINNFGQILSTRGCPGKCTYCFSLFNKCYRYRSAKKVFDEIVQLKADYGVDFINFIDDAFTINKKRLDELCDLFISSKLNLKWSCGTRVDFLDKEMIFKMKKAGCEMITLGIESCLPETLKGMNKVIGMNEITTPELYVKRADEILQWCYEEKIRVGVNILTGFPWETAEDMKYMQEYINRIKQKVTQGFYGGILQPQPGTSMYEKYAKEYGFEKWWVDKKPLFVDTSYRPFFMAYYHQYWDHLHNNFFNFNKKMFKEIDRLYRLMGKWNVYIFTKRRFGKNFLSYGIYLGVLFLSKFSYLLFKVSPKIERTLMERVKKFSYRFKFREGRTRE